MPVSIYYTSPLATGNRIRSVYLYKLVVGGWSLIKLITFVQKTRLNNFARVVNYSISRSSTSWFSTSLHTQLAITSCLCLYLYNTQKKNTVPVPCSSAKTKKTWLCLRKKKPLRAKGQVFPTRSITIIHIPLDKTEPENVPVVFSQKPNPQKSAFGFNHENKFEKNFVS